MSAQSDAAAMQRRLAADRAKFRPQVGAALYAEGEIENTEVKQRTPVKTGTLRGTEHVEGPEWKGDEVEVRLVAGGPAAPYAIRVHEDTEAFHAVGQAKFIESVVRESAPHMLARVGRRLKIG